MAMRPTTAFLAMTLLATAITVHAEFLRVEVTFQPTDCISCTESLQGRLERVRGVERVTLDLDRSVVTMEFEADNKVRLTPLLSRITQDGTKVSRTEVVVTGTVTRQGDGLRFQPDGLRETYRLHFPARSSTGDLQEDSTYKIQGIASGIEPGGEPVIEVLSAALVQ